MDIRSGNKIESDVDLFIPLPGRDFTLSRVYNSQPEIGGAGLVGVNWQLNVSLFLEQLVPGTNTSRLELTSLSGGKTLFVYDGVSKWFSSGPDEQFIEQETLDIDIGEGSSKTYPVYKLTSPGKWVCYFGRCYQDGDGEETEHVACSQIGTIDWRIGLLYRMKDTYNNHRDFKYATSGTQKRLETITFLTASDTVAGRVAFDWYVPGTDPTEIANRVKTATAQRWDGAWVDVQKAQYTYKLDDNVDSSDDVGEKGDLIQVVKSTRVGSLATETWHQTVIQYRYHDGDQTEVELNTDGDGDGLLEEGNIHQLKAVISPEQIEYAAERYSAANGYTSVTDFAELLLTMEDGETVFTESAAVKAWELASKLIPVYQTDAPYRVLKQYIQSSCGCSGTSQGVELSYSYIDYDTPMDGDYALTTAIDEAAWTGSSYVVRRTHYYDLVLQDVPVESTGTVPALFLANDVIKIGTDFWATSYLIDDTSHLVTAWYTPESVSSYTPGVDDVTPPEIEFHEDAGLVYVYGYNGGGRLTSTGVQKGSTGTPIITSVMTYGTNTSTTRDYLLNKIESHRVEGASAAGDVQTIEFKYIFGTDPDAPDAVQWVEVAYEAELTSENGPNGSGNKYYYHDYFDADGFNTWTGNQDGSLTKRTFSTSTGAVTSLVKNSSTSGAPSLPGGFSGSFAGRDGGTNSLTTTYAYTLGGQIESITLPTGHTTRYVYELRQPYERTGFTTAYASTNTPYLSIVALPHELAASEFDGPATVTWLNAAGEPIQISTFGLDANEESLYAELFDPSFEYELDLDEEFSRSTVQHSYSGLVKSRIDWHSIDGNGENSGIYTTTYEYDNLGRLKEQYAPNGTMTGYFYDNLDRVTSMSTGTSSANDVTVVEYFYDHALSGMTPIPGVGNGHVTWIRSYTGESSPAYRDTKYVHDFRGRVILVENPQTPHAMVVYDNLNRPIKAALFGDLPTTTDIDDSGLLADRGAYIEFKYSQRGLNYETRLKVDPTTTTGDYLSKFTWFDETGRPIATWNPNSPAMKVVYDGLGRVITSFLTDRRDDAVPGATDNRDDAASVSDDVVFEQTAYHYIASEGLNDLVTHRMRTHDADDTKVGDLSGFSGGDADLVITTFSGMYYDDADRVIRSVEYGTNQANFEYGGSAPTVTQGSPLNWNSGGDQIVREIAYDDRGRADLMTDPLGHKTKLIFDDLDRVIATIENFDNAALDSTTPWDSTNKVWQFTGISNGAQDEDRVTSTAFSITASPPAIRQVAYAFDSGGSPDNQITEYRFGVADDTGSEDSRITSNDLLAKIIYPDIEGGESEADHSVSFAYNRLGEQRFTKDQAGTKHAYTLDSLGRVTVDQVAAFGSAIDQTINAITYAFDPFGRTDVVRSYHDYGGGSEAIKNAVKFEYTSLWQVENVWQQHDGDVVTSGSPSPKVVYAYGTSNNANKNYSRVTSMTYPNGSYSLPYVYGTADSSNDLASRMTKLDIHGSGDGVEYSYIGAGLVALVDMAGPSGSLDVQLTRFQGADGTSSTGTYPGFDRFGRVKRHLWTDVGFGSVTGTPRIVDLSFTYDKASNLLTADNTNDTLSGWVTRDSKFTHDELDRLIKAERGRTGSPFVNASSSSAYTPGQAWGLDFLGNMRQLISDVDADGPDGDGSDNTETRSHNDANELTSLDPDGTGGAAAFTIVHDKAGNIVSRHQTYTDSNNYTQYTYVHDAWNRLVRVSFGGLSGGSELADYDVANYEYNGLSWRTVKRADTSLPTVDGIDEMHVYIYSAGWQMLEDRVQTGWSSGFTPNKIYQVIYGLRYIDDVVCRRLDSDVDGDYTDAGGSTTFYHLSDQQFSTVCVLDVDANVLERVSYDAYGRARHHRKADLTGDGGVSTDDLLTVIGNWGNSGKGDLNRDGTVGVADQLAVIGDWAAGQTLGVLSTTGNVFGFSGYVFNDEIAGNGGRGADRAGIYSVRFRHYDAALGRWLERDPLMYVDGMSMYQYVGGMPLRALDPYGRFLNVIGALVGGAIVGVGVGLWTGDWEAGLAAGAGTAIGIATFGAGTALLGTGWIATTAVGAASGVLGAAASESVDWLGGGEFDWDDVAIGGVIGGVLGPLFKALGPLANKLLGPIFKKAKGALARAARGLRIRMMAEGPGGPKEIVSGGCFVAGTLVAAVTALVPIEEVRAGDQVWSYDQERNEWTIEEVVETQSRDYHSDVVTLRLDLGNGTTEEITCTGNHPFWVVAGDRLDERPVVADLPTKEQIAKPMGGGRWTEARWLRLGDRFLTRTGYSATVVGLTIRMERVKVYNLQVNRLQLYAVGSAGVLVHNSGPALRPDVSPLSGGRGGGRVKGLTGPPNSVIKGSPGRIFITDENGRVIWDITGGRAKPVVPGQGFGDKQVPTAEQLDCINRMWPTQ